MTVRIEILGDMRIAGVSPKPSIPKKTRALMAYLSLVPDRVAPRERIADLLWPDQSPDRAYHNLRNSLWCVNRLGLGIFIADFSYVRLSPYVQSDANEFLASASSGNLEFACSLIRGRFLEAFEISSEPFEEWLSVERAKFDELYIVSLTRLSAIHTQTGRHALAIQAAQRAIELDSLSERAHQTLITAFQGAGFGGEAARHYTSMRRLFYKELGLSPSTETQQLLRKATEAPGPAAGAAAPDLTNEIVKLRCEIDALTNRIKTVEATAQHWREKYDALFNLVQRAKAKAADKRAARAAIAA
jgi:DNA-binding SARP family transcriptional activator